MNNLETLMTELARASIELKRTLYRRDDAASTTPEEVEGLLIEVHTCRVCRRSAAGKGAQVRHEAKCALARLQRAQKALREAWPELFTSKPAQASPAASTASLPALMSASAIPVAPGARMHPGDDAAPAERDYDMHAWPDSAPQSTRRRGRPKGIGQVGSDTSDLALHPGTVQAATQNG